MGRQWKKNNQIFILWGFLLSVFLVLMADRYCHMIYGNGIFAVVTGENELTEEEKKYLWEREELSYGETLDSFPAQLYEKKGTAENEEEGFAIDLMNQMSLEMETEIRFSPLLWPEVFESLESGKVDFIQISYSKERAEKYYLTAPLYESKGVVFLKKDGRELETLEELAGMKIAGIKEDYAMGILREKVPDLEIQEYNSIDECADALKKEQVAGIVADEQNIMYYAQQESMLRSCYVMEEEVYQAGVVFAVQKSEEKLGKILDKTVYKIRNSGILDKLQQRWFLESVMEPEVTEQDQYMWFAQTVGGVLAFILFLAWYIQKGTKLLVIERTRELAQERKRLEVILHSIPQYLLEIDKEGRIEAVNVKPGEEDEELAAVKERLQKLYEEKQFAPGSGEDHYVQRDMKINSRRYRVTVCSLAEEEERALIVLEDITVSYLQERQNIQNHKMAAIGQLAAGVSHELKNPLEIICNCCYALKKGILHTEEQVRETVGVIEEEAKDANKIVDNLLSFARVDPDQTELTHMKSFISMILKLQEKITRKKGIQMELDCEDDIYVRCNPEGMKRIFINIIQNAKDAVPEGGFIRISVKKAGENVKIEIQDNGKGMSEQEQEQIFNPFYTTKQSGTGLGMYLVYHQIQESKGTIDVSSVEGEGTVFTITLPGTSSKGAGETNEQ